MPVAGMVRSSLLALTALRIKMNRRTKKMRGYVNFPVNDPKWKFTSEGGMFVRVVVEELGLQISLREKIIPKDNSDNDFMQCCGGKCIVLYDESFIGTDKEEIYHFPRLNRQSKSNDPYKYTSIPYLAALTIGSTGWSGWDEAAGEYWRCTEKNLTTKGRELLKNLRNLYKGCKIHIQTWLDT